MPDEYEVSATPRLRFANVHSPSRGQRMFRTGLFLLACLPLGCTHLGLEKNTLRLSATVTDLRYCQVLDNLAMLAHNPAMLPYYCVITDGTAQVSDNTNVSGEFGWGWEGGIRSNSQTLGLGGSREVSDNWTLDPLHAPERLKVMRCVYQQVLGTPCQDAGCHTILERFQLHEALSQLPAGWYGIGCRKDVPKEACFVGHYRETYVWVMPSGVEGLTRLSLVILDIATVDLESLAPPTKVVVRKYDGTCKLIGVEVTQEIDETEPDCVDPTKPSPPKAPSGQGKPRKTRRELPPTYRGLFTLPRSAVK